MGAPSNAAARVSVGELPIRPGMLGDERLARLVGNGSERAFASIYDRYHQPLYRYCYSVLRDRDDAYDALQSTHVSAFAALTCGRRDAPLRPWLFRIAHNEAISLIRRRGDVWEPTVALQPSTPSAEDRAGERARLALLVADLQQLPERERSVLLMREMNGLSHRDIAVALGISIHTVKHAIYSARRSLGEFEEGREMVCKEVRRTISDGRARVLPRARAHLRDCPSWAAFAAAIPTRRADLVALAPPLPAVAAAGLLAGLRRAASTSGAGGGGTVAAGVAGKTAGAGLAMKALAGVAVLTIAGASVPGALSAVTRGTSQSPSGQAIRAKHARSATRHRKRPVGVHSSRGRLDAAVPSTGSPGSSGAPPSGAEARDSGPARELGTARPKGNGSPRGGKRSNVTGQARGSGARSATGARHGGGPSGTSGVAGHARGPGARSVAGATHAGGTPGAAANDGSPRRPVGPSAAEGNPGNSGAPTAAGGHPASPPPAASEKLPTPAAEGLSGTHAGQQQPHSGGQAQPS